MTPDILSLAGAAAGIVAVVVAILLPSYVLRRTVRSPAPGTPALPRDALVERLLHLNDARYPFVVRAGPEADLVVEWKFADATWWGVLSTQGLRSAYRLRLYFDDMTHRVAALDESGKVSWSAGLTTAPTVHYEKTFFRGVVLTRRERGVGYGLETPTGGVKKVLDYSLDVGWLKDIIAGAITASGWTYQPVLRAPKRADATDSP